MKWAAPEFQPSVALENAWGCPRCIPQSRRLNLCSDASSTQASQSALVREIAPRIPREQLPRLKSIEHAAMKADLEQQMTRIASGLDSVRRLGTSLDLGCRDQCIQASNPPAPPRLARSSLPGT